MAKKFYNPFIFRQMLENAENASEPGMGFIWLSTEYLWQSNEYLWQ